MVVMSMSVGKHAGGVAVQNFLHAFGEVLEGSMCSTVLLLMSIFCSKKATFQKRACASWQFCMVSGSGGI